MSVVVDASTLTTTLWPLHAKEAALQRNGQFLHLHVAGSNGAASVTCFAFDPSETTRAALGTSEGRLYGIDLRDNRLFLLADSGSTLSAIRAVCFLQLDAAVVSSAATVVVVYVTEAPQRMSIVEWSTGRQQDIVSADGGVHRRPIVTLTAITPTPSPQLAMLSLSADMLCCWSLVRRADTTGNKKTAALGAFTLRCVARATPAQAMTKVRVPTVEQEGSGAKKTKSKETEDGAREPAGFIAAHACVTSGDTSPLIVVTVETNGLVARWRLSEKTPRRDSTLPMLQLEQCVCTLPFRAACSAVCVNTSDEKESAEAPFLLLLGGRQTSAVAVLHGDFAHTEGGKGTCLVQLPQQCMGVRQLAALSARLVACTMSDGRVFVLCRTSSAADDAELSFRVAFVLDPPCRTSNKVTRRQPGLAVPWRFHVAALSFASYYVDGELYMLHLPTAKRWWQIRVHAAMQKEKANGAHSEKTANAGQDAASFTSGLLAASMTLATSTKTVAVPFLSQRYVGTRHVNATQSEGAENRQKRSSNDSDDGVHNGDEEDSGDAAVATHMTLHRAGPGAYYIRRSLTPLNTRRWVPVQLLPSELTTNLTRSGKATMTDGDDNGKRRRQQQQQSSGSGASQVDRRTLSGVVQGLFSEAQSVVSFCYNMDRLWDYLARYGSFPSDYRASIWRFVLGLPSLRVTAPQYAALARRPVHLCVEPIMTPFPLPPGPARTALESVISALAWHSPVFAMASFLPALAYPLLRVYDNDAQAVLELLLTFFINWGKDFFTCYPRSPTRLFVYLERVLRREDGPLAAHLQYIGAHADIWGWEAVLSLYTDCLSAAEWLQVMDHAFLMSPMWFFLFHIRHLISRRDELLQRCHNAQDVLRVLHTRAPDLALDTLLTQTYVLYDYCAANVVETVKDYFRFVDFGVGFVYPTVFACDETVVRARVRELDACAAARAETAAAAERLARLRAAAEVAALNEEMRFQQQSARVAAKYDTSARSWYSRVQQERVRQALEAQERAARLAAVDAQRREADRLGEWTTAMDYAAQQLRHDEADHVLAEAKWHVGAAVTNEELTRQTYDAQERLAAAMARVVLEEQKTPEEDEEEQEDEEERREDAPQDAENTLDEHVRSEDAVHVAEQSNNDEVAPPQVYNESDDDDDSEPVVEVVEAKDADAIPAHVDTATNEEETNEVTEPPVRVQRGPTPCSPLQERYEALHRHVCAPSLPCETASTAYERTSTSHTSASTPAAHHPLQPSRTLYDNLRESPTRRRPPPPRAQLLAPTPYLLAHEDRQNRGMPRAFHVNPTTISNGSATRPGTATRSSTATALSYYSTPTTATTTTLTETVTTASSALCRPVARARQAVQRHVPPQTQPSATPTWSSSVTSPHAESTRSETPLSSVPTVSDAASTSTSYDEDVSHHRAARRSRDEAYWQRH